MEENINIAKILNYKPEGTKLWTDMFGIVTLYVVTDACDAFQVKHHNKEPWFDEDGKLYKEGVLCIYPSKSMRDWSKFAWKKGDVLVSNDGKCNVIFDKFDDDKYTSFIGKHYLESYGKDGELQDYEEIHFGSTVKYTKESEEAAQTYINTIEERLGGKLNRETLEIEKQPEFKDGDVVVTDAVPSMFYSKCIFILKGDLNTGESRANSYVFFNINNNHISYDVLDTIERERNIHLATESEKQQLFSALEKEGKDWDSEHKMIVDFKPKFDELKPFDKVVVRCSEADRWSIDFFSYKVHNGYICTGDAWFGYCLPYNDETAHLLGTADDWKGGEG